MTLQPKVPMPILLVAVDGHGGSGKSTLAGAIAQHLGAEVLHTDDFASWDNPINWWPLLIERALEPIAKGATSLDYPRSKWWADHHPEPMVGQPVTPIMILEGVTSLRKEFRPYLGYSVFVETPAELCLQRGFARDQGMDGKSDAEIIAMWKEWIAAEDRYIESDDPRGFADAVVFGDQSLEPQLAALASAIVRQQNALFPQKQYGATESRPHHD